MKVVSPVICKGKKVNLPYSIRVEKPKLKIGVFGDSFAQLAEHALNKNFSHETSWIYYLSNLLNANCDSWGISCSSLADMIYLYNNKDIDYDIYLFLHTDPTRSNSITATKLTNKLCTAFTEDIIDKKTIMIYWNRNHNFFNFKTSDIIYANYHITNQNPNEINSFEVAPNPLDQLGGFHHMSNRGNLLLAIEINKCIANLI